MIPAYDLPESREKLASILRKGFSFGIRSSPFVWEVFLCKHNCKAERKVCDHTLFHAREYARDGIVMEILKEMEREVEHGLQNA